MDWFILKTIKTKERVEIVKNVIEDIFNLYGTLKEEIETTINQNEGKIITVKKEYKKTPRFDVRVTYDDYIILTFKGNKKEYETLKNYLYIKYDLLVD